MWENAPVSQPQPRCCSEYSPVEGHSQGSRRFVSARLASHSAPAELEAERIRLVSATRKAAETEPEVQFHEREQELVRG
jgi:hypothetical protein